MTYNCLIVDDERPALKLLEAYIAKLPHLNLVASCENGMQAIAALQQHSVDLLFLDIQMPDLTGLELLQTLKIKPQVVLTTAYRDYAVEGFALNATDYLVKPYSFERFVQAVNKCLEIITLKSNPEPQTTTKQSDITETSPTENHFFVKTAYKMERVEFEDIRYIESMREYVSIHTKGRRFVVHHTMNNMEEKLPKPNFIRIHRSYIVAMNYIEAINGNTVHIEEKVIPVGGSYRKAFFEKIKTL